MTLLLLSLFLFVLSSRLSISHKHATTNSSSSDPKFIGQSRYYSLVKAFREKNIDESDKIMSHHYEIMYGQYLEPFMDEKFKLLEIGVLKGQSLHLWSRVFENIDHVYGVGYGEGITSFDKKKVIDKRTTQFYADQSSVADLNFIIEDIGRESVHVINDDGSHIPWHQAFTFEKLFSELLAPGGVYILEDIETSYWNSPNAALYGYPIKTLG